MTFPCIGNALPTASRPAELVRRHLLLVAKTRRGKSTLLLRLARYVMEGHGTLGRRPALVLIDPHRDLAHAALGLVPPDRADDLVFLEVGQTEHPFGLNLLDVGLGWERDRAVEQALYIFRRQWEHYWGPRMESAFRFGLQTLLAANATLCARDGVGRARQFTILDVSPLLSDTVIRRSVLPLADDPVVRAWWATEFDPLDRRFQLEIVNPVYFDLDDDGWLDALCRRPSRRILNFGDVEDAAYWHRAQQLITAAADGSGERTG